MSLSCFLLGGEQFDFGKFGEILFVLQLQFVDVVCVVEVLSQFVFCCCGVVNCLVEIDFLLCGDQIEVVQICVVSEVEYVLCDEQFGFFEFSGCELFLSFECEDLQQVLCEVEFEVCV